MIKNEDSIIYLHGKIIMMNLICYLFPILLSLILLFFEKFGKNSNHICWIRLTNLDKEI